MKQIKNYILFLAFTAVVLSTVTLYAQEKIKPDTQEIILYNFVPEKESPLAYSYVIPYTLSKELSKNQTYKINRLDDAKGSISKPYDKKLRDYILSLRKKTSTGERPDYLLTGTYLIEKGTNGQEKLSVKVQVFNVRAREEAIFEYKSDETGAILQKTIDDLAQKISVEINAFIEENRKRYAGSPYLPLYHSIDNIRLGIRTGTLNLFGKWSDVYNDTEFISFFIFFETDKLIKNTGLSLNFDHFHFNNHDNDSSVRSYMKVWGGSLLLHYSLVFSDTLAVDFSAGGGYAYSEVKLFAPGTDGPFSGELAEETSYDPYSEARIQANFTLSSLVLGFGTSYKRIFYTDEPLNSYELFISLAYAI